jgi:hypothetical protein
MKAPKALRAILFTFILTIGSLLPALTSTPVLAEPNTGQTTLYFTDALNFIESGNFSDLGFATISQNVPIKQNDSEYPPTLFIKNTSKTLPRYNLNADQWINWFTTTWILYFLNSSEFDLNEIFNIFGNGTSSGLELFIPNPYRIIEEFTYNGNDTVTIDGDLYYNLYFSSPNKKPKFIDSVKIGLYSWNINSFPPLPKHITNTTVKLSPIRSTDIYKQQITLPNVQYTLTPGESLLFSVEIIPTNKTIPEIIKKRFDVNRFIERLGKRATFLENRQKLPTLQNIGTTIKDIISVLNETAINITSADIAALVNAMLSSSLIYDSSNHPASVTIPAKIIEEDIRDYFLYPNQEMSETRPNNTTSTSKSKLTTTPIIWSTTQALDRNKILKLEDVTASLYFYRSININLVGKITITATLYDDNISLATSEHNLTRKDIETFISGAQNPILFTFTGADREITYGHHLNLGISLSNGTKLVFLKPLYLRYDSVYYPSSIRIKFEETQNIQIHDVTKNPSDGKIIPGGNVQYILNVTSTTADSLQIRVIEREKTGTWDVITPTSVTVSAKNWVKIPVFINSTNNLKEAYGNIIDLVVEVTGNTGIARQTVSAEISQDAIRYDVEILGYSNNINISKGENRTFYFVIKNNNTGAIDDTDSYTITASSKNDWPLIPRENIRNLGIGDSTETDDARVVIQVPKNTTLTSDVITIIVTSDNNPSTSATINITVHVIAGDLLESIYNLFDSAANSLGLNEMFGSYGAIVLVSILMVIILFILIILALVFTTKHVRIICTDRIKEIEAAEKAIYELTLQNPRKKTQSYEILAQQTAPSSKWMIAVEPLAIAIDGRQSKTVQIIVTPTDNNESKDWTQITVHVKKTGKKKTENITLIAMIKEGKTLLTLDNVSHWPTAFNPGEKVTTSCSISNNGTVSARNVKVFFYLNGKQKNMVEVTIPSGSIADLQIPWIAIKGKNQVRIRLKEQ